MFPLVGSGAVECEGAEQASPCFVEHDCLAAHVQTEPAEFAVNVGGEQARPPSCFM
jgi:hypothetical protein